MTHVTAFGKVSQLTFVRVCKRLSLCHKLQIPEDKDYRLFMHAFIGKGEGGSPPPNNWRHRMDAYMQALNAPLWHLRSALCSATMPMLMMSNLTRPSASSCSAR